MKLDFQELLAERSLVDTEDWLDDPDEPIPDSFEVDLKTLPGKKIKTIREVIKEQDEKFKFFQTLFTSKNRVAYEPT